jgi:hypothetical protein
MLQEETLTFTNGLSQEIDIQKQEMQYAIVTDANDNEIDRLDLYFVVVTPDCPDCPDCTCATLQPSNIYSYENSTMTVGEQIAVFSFGDSIPEFDYETDGDTSYDYIYEDSVDPNGNYKVLRVKLNQQAIDNKQAFENTTTYKNIIFKEKGTNNVIAVGTFIYRYMPSTGVLLDKRPFTVFNGGYIQKESGKGWVAEIEEFNDGNFNLCAMALPELEFTGGNSYAIMFYSHNVRYIDSDGTEISPDEYYIELHVIIKRTDGTHLTVTIIPDIEYGLIKTGSTITASGSNEKILSIRLHVSRKGNTPQRNGKMRFEKISAAVMKQF